MPDPYGKSPGECDGPARVHLARVTHVNIALYTLDLVTLYTHKPMVDVPFATPYCHPNHAGGMNFMPEVDSYCYVCEPADGTVFIIGFVLNPMTSARTEVDDLAEEGPDWSGFRDPMEAGDVMLGTHDENKIVLRRGGIIQIAATSLAQRLYIPVENIVRDYFQRYQARSPLGEIDWGHAILSGDDPNADHSNYMMENTLSNETETPVLVKYSIKDLAQEDVKTGNYSVELRVGRLTPEVLDPQGRRGDGFHVFANKQTKVWDGEAETATDDGDGLRAEDGLGMPGEEKGIVSFTIYCHDKGDFENKVTYAFQINREGNLFMHTKSHVHMEIDESVYARVKKGVRLDFGAKGGEEEAADRTRLELTEDDKIKAFVEETVIKTLKKFKIISEQAVIQGGDIFLGGMSGAQEVVLKDDLGTFLTTEFQCATAWGPSGPMLVPIGDVGSSCTKSAKTADEGDNEGGLD